MELQYTQNGNASSMMVLVSTGENKMAGAHLKISPLQGKNKENFNSSTFGIFFQIFLFIRFGIIEYAEDRFNMLQ